MQNIRLLILDICTQAARILTKDAKLVASLQPAHHRPECCAGDSTLLFARIFATFQFHSMTDGYAKYRSAQCTCASIVVVMLASDWSVRSIGGLWLAVGKFKSIRHNTAALGWDLRKPNFVLVPVIKFTTLYVGLSRFQNKYAPAC